MQESQPKILLLDIEWAPVKAYVWKAWDETVMPDQVIEDGGLLCVAWKWEGQLNHFFYSEWSHGKVDMLSALFAAIEQADAVVTYNGERYDLKKIQGELLRHGLPPLPPVTSIDLIKTVKKMGYFRNSLGYIGPFLGLGSKLKNEGFSLWKKVLDGDEEARQSMKDYNVQDVYLLESLYERIKPFITTHPHLGFTTPDACPVCGSSHIQKRGVVRTRHYITQRLHCQSCSHWYTGTKKKIK